MENIKSELVELLRRNDLLRAALLPGKVLDPNFDSNPYIDKVLELAAKVWHRSNPMRSDVILKAESINSVLYQDANFAGKSEKYKHVIDDPERYYLHRVLEKRAGSPLTMAILYCILGEQIGLNYECYALPSYYLIKVTDVATEFYIDPFDKGRFLKPEEFHRKFKVGMERNRMMSTNLFEKVTPQQLVARLVQQLKHVYILKGDALVALRAVEMLSALFPQSPEITRDRGILYCEMEYFSKAIDDLRFYLKERPQAEDFSEIKKLTSMLKGYREIMN
jgi:regulator of sirC expression with transglutaminase-like and TPR domain